MDETLLGARLMRNWQENLDWAGLQVRAIMEAEWASTARVLDVGAGKGKYRLLLPEYACVDAVEIWLPYVTGYGLHDVYRAVYQRDIVELAQEFGAADVKYDVVIMGDVLEHLTVDDARITLTWLKNVTGEVLIIVPYNYEQGEEHGNPHQRHEQPDLTVENMHQRYPDLRLDTIQVDAASRPFKGLYRWR